jgi:hypothetical protein
VQKFAPTRSTVSKYVEQWQGRLVHIQACQTKVLDTA